MYPEILTNPLEHQRDSYVYCVYAFHQSNPALNTLEGIRATVDMIQNPNRLFSASLVGRLDPQTAQNRFGLYETISQTGMFGDIGLVIGLSNDAQVRIAWNCDLASGLTEDERKKFVIEHGGKIKDPHYLLTQTVGYGCLGYNELIISGHEETNIKGVCYGRKSDLTKIKAELLGAILEHISGYKVPVVSLIDEEDETAGYKMLGEIIATIPEIIHARAEFFSA